jgi:adenylate cyclase
MNARLERKLRLLAIVITLGAISGVGFNLAQGRSVASAMAVGMTYGLVMSLALGAIELFILDGPLRTWLNGLSFTVNLFVRSAIYATVPPFAVHDLGRLPIRGRADGIDVFGIEAPALT